MSARAPISRTAPLLFWLALVCGLAGMTLLRFDPHKLPALWVGTLGGAAIGHALAHFRIRAWVPIVTIAVGGWFVLGALVAAVDGIFGSEVETFIQAFIPATICGYLALSERGALLAFWYPAVLWMVVILDGTMPGAIDARASAPFAIGLVVLFVAFLRARETRRAQIWRAQGQTPIAPASQETVLRRSPLRVAASHAWTAMVTIASLALASWVAPQLWQKEKSMQHAQAVAAAGNAALRPTRGTAALPCCEMSQPRERVKEYFEIDPSGLSDITPAGCRACMQRWSTPTTSELGVTGWGYAGTPGAGLGVDVGSDPWSSYVSAYGSSASYETSGHGTYGYDPYATSPLPSAPTPPSPPPTAAPLAPTATPDSPASPPARTEDPVTVTSPSDSPAGASAMTPRDEQVVRAPSTFTFGAPWRSILAFSLTAWLVWIAGRAIRRLITLRHLARPFWNESTDQRISNHWERVLIALRDGGLEPARDEQPSAFARRVGIADLERCATILERVRHGVRVDDDDLVTMESASSAVVRHARARAGMFRRAVAFCY